MIVLQVRPIHFRVWGCKGSYAGLRLNIKVKCCFCSCAKIRTVYASFVFICIYWSRFFNPEVTWNNHSSEIKSKFSHFFKNVKILSWDDRPPVTLHLLLKLRSQVILRISRDKDLRMHGVCCSLHVWDLWWPLMTIVSLLALRVIQASESLQNYQITMDYLSSVKFTSLLFLGCAMWRHQTFKFTAQLTAKACWIPSLSWCSHGIRRKHC